MGVLYNYRTWGKYYSVLDKCRNQTLKIGPLVLVGCDFESYC